MRYEILGPLRITNGSAPVTITASRERTLLAMLLLHANQPVPRTQLIEAIWAGHPPPGAHNQLQGCVSRLRRLLAETVGSAGLIVTEPAGYRATVAPDDLDLVQFRDYVAQARQAAAAGDQTQASNHYRAGLALWRGPTLAGVDSDPVRHAAAALDEEHDQAVEERIDLELAIDAGPLVAELTDLVSRHPHRERLHRALMLALYRSGRQADALAAYQRARRLLRDELGIEPGVELQRLHQAILNRDPALDDPPGPAHPAPAAGARSPVPRELPADVAGFTGRTDALKTLDDELLTDAPDGGPAPVVISAIAGTAGVGKTALAVHWAHRIANRFPDGQLYLNLRGYATEPPLRPIDALAALLRSMSTPPDQIPTEEAEAAGRYRSQLAGRRMLVVLDNAGSVDQVRPLLPGSPGCLALITSRDRLAGLVARDGARRINLDVLPPDEAYAMLNRLLGGRRVADEPEATAALAQACAYLPLALRIAAAGLTDHPDRSIAGYVAQLTNGDRLAMLRADGDQETAVLATLDLSYQRLPTDTQRLFRLLGLVPGPDFTPAAAAALAGSTVEDVQPLLTRLTSAHLLTEHAPGRYTFHDLLRLYGRQRAEAEDPADLRAGAMTRLLTWYLHTADSAATLLYPRMFRLPAPPREVSQPPAGFDRSSGAAVWLEAERANLVAAIQVASDGGPRQFAWLLADILRGYFWRNRYTIDWLTAAQAAMTAANVEGDLRERAAAQLNLASMHHSATAYPKAIAGYQDAAKIARDARWDAAQAAALGNLGIVEWQLGHLARAADYYRDARTLNQRAGRTGGEAGNSLNLGLVNQELGRLAEAIADTRHALALCRHDSDPFTESTALNNLGLIEHDLGRLGEAHAHHTDALKIKRESGDVPGQAAALDGLASVDRDAGRVTRALDYARASVAVTAELGDHRYAAQAINTLGSVYLQLQWPQQARDQHLRALELAESAGARLPEIEALLGLALVEVVRGRLGPAVDRVQRALSLASRDGYRVLEGKALTILAEIRIAQGRYEEAGAHARHALDHHRETGHRLGEANALAALGTALHRCGDPQAREHWRVARELFTAIGAPMPEELAEVE